MSKIQGLVCAPFTAFDAQGSVDLAKVSLQAKFYKDNGKSGQAKGTKGSP